MPHTIAQWQRHGGGGLRGFSPSNPKSPQRLPKKNGIKLVGYTFRLKNYVKIPLISLGFFRAGAATAMLDFQMKLLWKWHEAILFCVNGWIWSCIANFSAMLYPLTCCCSSSIKIFVKQQKETICLQYEQTETMKCSSAIIRNRRLDWPMMRLDKQTPVRLALYESLQPVHRKGVDLDHA